MLADLYQAFGFEPPAVQKPDKGKSKESGLLVDVSVPRRIVEVDDCRELSIHVVGRVLTFLSAVCREAIKDPVATGCGHMFCNACLKTALEERATCPTCRAEVKHFSVYAAGDLTKRAVDLDGDEAGRRGASKLRENKTLPILLGLYSSRENEA